VYGWNAPGIGWQSYQTVTFPSTMRTSPTVSSNWSGVTNCTVSPANTGTTGVQLQIVAAAGGNFFATYNANNTMSSEL
jgi:hypothetical protein